MGRVENKVAFITGVARGQGRSHAVRLAQEGADIIGVDLCRNLPTSGYDLASEQDLEETVRLVEKQGRRMLGIQADVRERAQLVDAVNRGVAEFGKLDVVVAQAAVCNLKTEATKRESWIDGVDVDLVGVINAVHAALPHLTAGGSIIATGSAAAFMPYNGHSGGQDPGGASYMYAKKSLTEFIVNVALQFGVQSIRANVIHPTNVNTDMLHNDPMYRSFRPDKESPTRAEAEEMFPVQQLMPIPYIEPEDISNMVLFLASDESRYVTGMQMRVDAGCYLKYREFTF